MKRSVLYGGKKGLYGLYQLLEQYFTKFSGDGGVVYRDRLIGPTKKNSIFITDRLEIYNFKCAHQYCLAHIKRNLNRFAQRSADDGGICLSMDYLQELAKVGIALP